MGISSELTLAFFKGSHRRAHGFLQYWVIFGYHSVHGSCSCLLTLPSRSTARNSRLPRLSEHTSRAGLGVSVIRDTVLIQTNSDSSAQRELLCGEFVREMLRSAGTGSRGVLAPHRPAALRGPAVEAPAERPSEEFQLSWKAKPSRRRAPSGTNKRPGAAGRNNIFGDGTLLPSRSAPAVAPPPREAAGTASAGEPPLAPAAGSCPCPAALCPMQGRNSRGAALARPQRPQLPASPFLVFPFRNSLL